MLSVAHTAAGAFIATKLPYPLVSIPLIIASHYILDFVPHWDAGTGLSSGKKSPSQAFMAEIPDLILSFILIVVFFQIGKPLSFTTEGLSPYWGAFFAILPDFLEAPRNFLKKEPSALKPLNNFHHSFHNSTPNKLKGLLPQILLITIIYLLK